MNYQSKLYAFLVRSGRTHAKLIFKSLQPKATDKILDIGCARGRVTKYIQEAIPHTYGVDINEEAIKYGLARNLQAMSAEDLKFSDATFDKVYSLHTIEHVTNAKKMVMEIDRVLKPGGSAMIVYPAEGIQGLFATVSALILFGNPFRARELHVRLLYPSSVQKLIEGTHLKHVLSKFVLFPGPQFVTLLSKE